MRSAQNTFYHNCGLRSVILFVTQQRAAHSHTPTHTVEKFISLASNISAVLHPHMQHAATVPCQMPPQRHTPTHAYTSNGFSVTVCWVCCYCRHPSPTSMPSPSLFVRRFVGAHKSQNAECNYLCECAGCVCLCVRVCWWLAVKVCMWGWGGIYLADGSIQTFHCVRMNDAKSE